MGNTPSCLQISSKLVLIFRGQPPTALVAPIFILADVYVKVNVFLFLITKAYSLTLVSKAVGFFTF